MLKDAGGDGLDVVGCDEVATLQQCIGLASLQHGHGSTWRGSQKYRPALTRLLHNLDDIAHERVLDEHRTECGSHLEQLVLSDDGLDVVELGEPCVALVTVEYVDLLVGSGIADGYLHHESVELGLGQLVGALLLDGVLCGDDGVDGSHLASRAVDADLPFLHDLEQRSLSLGRRTVDLID